VGNSTPTSEPVLALELSRSIAVPKSVRTALHDNTVLSFSFERDLLPQREDALHRVGYHVFSTTSEACVRFEIQMGQCGVLLLCYTIPDAIRRDLTALFERHCHSGVIVLVMDPLNGEATQSGQVCLLDSDFPHKLHLIKDFRDRHRSTA
jgi:hypothetical protein